MKPFKLKVQNNIIPESYIEAQIFAYLKGNGIFVWKVDSVGIYDPKRKIFRTNSNPNRIKGVSDIIGVLPGGRILAIEVKNKRGVVSPEQKSFVANVVAHGGLAMIARSVEDVREQIVKFFAELNHGKA